MPASDFRKMFRFKLSKIQMRERTNGKRRLTPLRLSVHACMGQVRFFHDNFNRPGLAPVGLRVC